MAVLARGVEAIVLIAPAEGNVTLAGGVYRLVGRRTGNSDSTIHAFADLTLNLPNPEPITHVKIRIKGLVRTVVLKMNGSGRHPVVDEVIFWEDTRELYTDGAFLAANESSDPLKLQGVFNFPFSLHLPPNIPRVSAATGEIRKYRLPPSFVLNASTSINGGNDEWASVRYFVSQSATIRLAIPNFASLQVKVTVGRKGMLKQNERLLVRLSLRCSKRRADRINAGSTDISPSSAASGMFSCSNARTRSWDAATVAGRRSAGLEGEVRCSPRF